MVEFIGIVMMIISVVAIYPYTKERYAQRGKLPFDSNRLKIK